MFNLINLIETDSTNNYAKNLLCQNVIKEGTIIKADRQFAGRGMDSNKWESDEGKNLTFSKIYYPHFLPIGRQFMLNKAIALAVSDFIKSKIINHTVSIKWPNDIYVYDNKICGILIENILKGDVYETAIIGIGLNVNQLSFNPDIPNPTSLRLILKQELKIDNCLSELNDFIEQRYKQLMKTKFSEIDNDYLNRLYNFNIIKSYSYKGRKITACIIGLTEFGQLIVKTIEGEEIICNMKEIKLL